MTMGKANIKGYVGPRFSLLINNVVGPFINAEGYIKAESDPKQSPWWNLYGGIDVNGGAVVTILSWTLAEYKANLLNYEILLASAPGPADTTAPSALTGLTAKTASSNEIKLTWNASTDTTDVTGYQVERCRGSDCTDFTRIAIVTPTTTSYSDTGLSASTSYSYRVQATDAMGNVSGYSMTAVATTFKQSLTLSVIKLGHGTVASEPSGIDCGSSCSALFDSETAVTLTATPDTDNVFRGWGGACSGMGTCIFTMNTDEAVTASFSPSLPSAPTGITANRGIAQITLTWTANPVADAVTTYTLYMASESGVTKSNYADLTSGMKHTNVTSPYTHTGLTSGTTSYFVITAVNAAGESVESNQISATQITYTIKIAAGNAHTCALTTTGGVKCWGNNGAGQLGDGTTTNRYTPVDVSGLVSDVMAIVAGDNHTCALTTAGSVKCWGWNDSGQLGDGTTTDNHTPVEVSGLGNNVAAIAAGEKHTCVLTTAGGVKCWGRNYFGQLGDGTIIDSVTPVAVSGLVSGVKAITTGDSHTCALTMINGVKCWGYNFYGQLGDGTTGTNRRLTPVEVSELGSEVKAIAAGYFHTCALTISGGVKCWGYNGPGQLGDGTTHQRSTPVDVSGLASGVMGITAGFYRTCAITTAGGIKCWGYNNFGQLGDGTTTDSLIPVDTSGLGGGVIVITAGYNHTCAVTTAEEIKCWGSNAYGKLGNGTTMDSSTPVSIVGF